MRGELVAEEMRGEGSWGSSSIQEGCDGRCGSWEGWLEKGKVAGLSAFG